MAARHSHSHASAGPHPVEAALVRLKAEGLRITPQREDIIAYLAKRRGRHSARSVFEAIRKKHRNISADRQYEFQEAGHHHHHAVCLSCGQSSCLNVCPLPDKFFEDLEAYEFRVVSHAFEVYGYCAKCR